MIREAQAAHTQHINARYHGGQLKLNSMGKILANGQDTQLPKHGLRKLGAF